MVGEFETFEKGNDSSDVLVYKCGTHEFIIKKDPDHHGMWIVRRPNGNCPGSLAGRFTSPGYAQAQIDSYVNANCKSKRAETKPVSKPKASEAQLKSVVKDKKEALKDIEEADKD